MTHGGNSLGYLLHDAARLVRKRFERRAESVGLSSAQWRLLAITLREGRVAQARLSERLEIEPISVSRLVDRMEQAGWVARQADPGDRRVRVIVPTAQALAAHAEIRALLDEVLDEALSGFSDAERIQVVGLLKRLIANLGEAGADSDAEAAAKSPAKTPVADHSTQEQEV
jgi:DNA-binding MarR family transcriptional regulator